MHRVIAADDQQRSPGGTLTFEGEAYGSGVSFFLVNNQPVHPCFAKADPGVKARRSSSDLLTEIPQVAGGESAALVLRDVRR